VPLAPGLLLLITLINLRGMRDTGAVMAIPVYLSPAFFFSMLVNGMVRLVVGGPVPLSQAAPAAVQPVTPYLILHTFSTGSTVLTGVEAISNGVSAFQPPRASNFGRTLIVMALFMAARSLGSIGLTQFLGVVSGPKETILSALARTLFDANPIYLLMQFATVGIPTVAANTSFAGFPHLAAILACDGFLPRQFGSLGDRSAFSNGILVLSLATAGLIIAFGGDTRALVTGTTLVIVRFGKFLEGAWISILLIPVFVLLFRKVRRALSLRGLPPSLFATAPSRVVIPISGVHRGVVGAGAFAQYIFKNVTAV
jgi:hypothetical protein